MRSSNPALLSNPFTGFGRFSDTSVMTIRGTVNKTLLLLALVILPAALIWRSFYLSGQNPASIQIWMFGGLIAGFILSLVTVFKKDWAPITAPLYALAEGLFLGGISGIFENAYPGIVSQAVSLTVATLLVMLVVYKTGLIRASENFKLGVVAATGGIAIVYLVSIVLSFFGIQVPFVTGSGLFSILFSVFVVCIAALNFIIDFDFIEQGSRSGAPKYMEWYGAFALMVTLIWLYIEILRLLAKLNDRRG
ncbi:MAG: Bax inhibitor-1/YccA family protein [Parachlamydia sp.]|jgi:uncharacterized YccA/Bax inhibitor family protein|nr:Bax inhibitor-1/YccA family protein [Parachlamydia sp.]